MGKFRSKLKRHGKGKNWNKGQSAISNPEKMKHRLKATSRFLQSNLNLASSSSNGLTTEAVYKHEQRHAYNAETTTINDVAGSLMSFKLDEDDSMSGSITKPGTSKTFQTFASSYSSCSNVSFQKLLTGFRASSDLHKEMLAILSALSEVIRERGGIESSSEYFLLLISQIEAAIEERDIIAGVALLSMGIKSVPAPVLRKRFDQTASTLQQLLQRFIDTSNQSVIRYLIASLSVLLRAQDYATWTYSSTFQYFDGLLVLSVDSRPKIRKAAQHAVVSIIHGSCFMLPPALNGNADEDIRDDQQQTSKINHHPASNRVTKFCLAKFNPDVLVNGQTTVLYTLALLKDTLAGFRTEDIRSVCEHLLSIMTAANVLLRTNCFQALHALFHSRSFNLNAKLCAKLIIALHEYQPGRSDVRQTLAWITMLKEGYLHLAFLQLELCMHALPRLFEIFTEDLWLSEQGELVVGVSNCIKELLQDCVFHATSTKQLADQYRPIVAKIIGALHKVLKAPFSQIYKYVILIFSILFEACGKHFGSELIPSLTAIGKRYETQGAFRLQVEHTLITGIKTLGPELVLRALPLSDASGNLSLERSWLLPLLREGSNGASLKFFFEYVVPLALQSQSYWRKYSVEENNKSKAHIYELLCCQLWGLFPGFCRQPRDPEYISKLAPTLGDALEHNLEFRAPIYDGLMELLEDSQSSECHAAIGQYARNFLPRLFNIYTQKPNGSYEADQRKRSLDVIRAYIGHASTEVQAQLFASAQNQLAIATVASFEYDAYFDINAAIVRVQKCRSIEEYFQKYMAPVLRNDKSKLVSRDEQKMKKQQRKTYELLREIMTSDHPSCQKFTRKNCIVLQQILVDGFNTTCSVCQASRLYCLKSLLDCRIQLTYSDQLVMKAIPEAVLNYKQFSTRKEQIAEELIKQISNLYQEAGKINEFVDILTAGFTGEESLITNTILAFRAVLQQQGQYLSVSTLEFVLQQVSVFLVQKSRYQAEAAVAFLITYIKLMPIPLVANHLETIMRSLSAMTKDTKRYCRIQIGYFLKKLCKRFTTEELARFVPGDDEVTHRRLKKIRKEMRRDTRKQQSEEAETQSTDDELVGDFKQTSFTIDDILADSDSDFPENMEIEESDRAVKNSTSRLKTQSKQERSTYIHEDTDEIVDLTDLKSISNVLTKATAASGATSNKQFNSKPNGGFKITDDGRLIISDKSVQGQNDDSESDDVSAKSGHGFDNDNPKPGMEENSSDEGKLEITSTKRKRQTIDASSTHSVRTSPTTHKGIHRLLNATADEAKPAKPSKSQPNTAGREYTSKKAKGDMKRRSKLDPYAYIPLTRNTLNKRKRTLNSRRFKIAISGDGKTPIGRTVQGSGGGREIVVKSYK